MASQTSSALVHDIPNELPFGWRCLRLVDVIAEVATGDWGEERPKAGLTPAHVIRGTDFDRTRRGLYADVPIRYLTGPSLEKRRAISGDLFVELSGGSNEQPTGRILQLPELFTADLPVAFGNFVKRVRINSSVVAPAFFAHYWDFLYRAGRTRTYEKRTTGIRNFKIADFVKSEQILVPPIQEQESIVSVLRSVQRARLATEKVLDASRQAKRALLRHLFTEGPVSVAASATAETVEVLGFRFPAAWGWTTLQEVAAGGKDGVQGGPFGSRLTRKDYVDSGVPVIRGNNLSGSGRFVSSGFAFVSPHKAAELSRHKARPGDLVVTQRGSLGQVGIVPADGYEEYVISQSQMKATIDAEKASCEFLFYFFQTPMALRQIANDRVQSGVPHINLASFRAFKTPLPPRSMQDSIAAILSATDRKIEVEERRHDRLETLFGSLLRDLLVGRRRVMAEAA